MILIIILAIFCVHSLQSIKSYLYKKAKILIFWLVSFCGNVMELSLNCDLSAFYVWKSHKANNKILRAWKVMMVLKHFELAMLVLLKMSFNEIAFLGKSTESIPCLCFVGFFFPVMVRHVTKKKVWNGIFAFVFNSSSKNTCSYHRAVLFFFFWVRAQFRISPSAVAVAYQVWDTSLFWLCHKDDQEWAKILNQAVVLIRGGDSPWS